MEEEEWLFVMSFVWRRVGLDSHLSVFENGIGVLDVGSSALEGACLAAGGAAATGFFATRGFFGPSWRLRRRLPEARLASRFPTASRGAAAVVGAGVVDAAAQLCSDGNRCEAQNCFEHFCPN